MSLQCAWPQPGYWQLRLSALPFSLGSEAEPFSGIPLSSPLVLQWEGWLEGRLAGEITLMSWYLCTPPQPWLSSHLPYCALSFLWGE